MADPKTLLPWLLGGAIGVGGILQGLSWRSSSAQGDVTELKEQLRILTDENEILQRENESLRSLAQGGGELAVPQELVERVEKEYGLSFKSTPVIHRASTDELRDRISAAFESGFGPAGVDYRQEAYTLIGWLLPDDKLLSQLTAVRSVGARGWFDDEMGEAWVTDKFQIGNIPDQAALVRLLARILLHQHFPPAQEYPGDEPARAREALHQGAASGSEARFYAANARSIGFMPMTENSDAEQLLNSLSPFIQGLTMFPVMDGKTFADTLLIKGKDEFQKVLKDPPKATRDILHPGADPRLPAMVALPEFEEPFLSESAGELGLRLWLEPLGDAGVALEISSSWQEDRYHLIPDGEASSAVVWDILLDSTEAADALQAAALDLAAGMAGKEETIALATPVETLEKRYVLVSRPGANRVRFLNTVLKETAEKMK